jgi:hypothetical protein
MTDLSGCERAFGKDVPRYWYHGTTEDKINLILKEGLKRGMPYSDVTKECGFAPFGGVPFEEMHKTMESLVPMPVSLGTSFPNALSHPLISVILPS